MKKRDLATLAMIGVSAGLIVAGCQQTGKRGSNNNGKRNNNNNYRGSMNEQTSPDMETFRSSLSPQARNKFDALDAQHKMMAVEMANQSCNGKNSCAGMGGCATKDHSCAGKNSCKGKGGPPVKDPEEAVDVQYDHQMQERHNMQNGMEDNGNKSGNLNTNVRNRY